MRGELGGEVGRRARRGSFFYFFLVFPFFFFFPSSSHPPLPRCWESRRAEPGCGNARRGGDPLGAPLLSGVGATDSGGHRPPPRRCGVGVGGTTRGSGREGSGEGGPSSITRKTPPGKARADKTKGRSRVPAFNARRRPERDPFCGILQVSGGKKRAMKAVECKRELPLGQIK